MADIDLKTETPDTTLPATGFLFGADSQASASPSVYSTQAVATTLLGSTTLSGTTITANAPVVDFAQTWNNAAVTFTGAKLNITDTASNAASLLMDLQVGGSSQAAIRKDGRLILNGPASNASIIQGTAPFRAGSILIGFSSNGGAAFGDSTGATIYASVDSRGFVCGSSFYYGFTSGSISSSPDLFLTRRGAANLRLGAADAATPVAQTLSVQSVVAGTTNTAGTNLTITGSQGTGTGAGGSIVFQVAPAGSSGTAQNALADALTINSARQATFAGNVVANEYRGISGALILTASSYFQLNGNLGFIAGIPTNDSSFSLGPSVKLGFAATNGQAPDTVLNRDAANTLALRNGTAAQTFNVYNTFTSSTNFERFRIFAQSAAAVLIGTEKGSAGGTARDLELQTDGTTRLTIAGTGAATFAANIDNPVSITGSAPNFNGLSLQNTSATGFSSTGFTAQNNQTAQMIMRVYGSGVTSVSVWGTTIANYAGLLTDGASSNGFLIGTLTADPVIFGTDTSEKMRITSAGLITFGGTTSSFPALKRSSASLIVRLADDTANAALESASLKTDAPTGGTAATWKLGAVATVTPTLQNRTIEVDIGGTIYYISAKTTND